MQAGDSLYRLLRAFAREGVQYVLVGGHAVRFNGFLRATEDIDVLLPPSRENGERVLKALGFLRSTSDIPLSWFEPEQNAPENIRIADDLLIDLLFSANGETFETLQPHIKTLRVDDVDIQVLDIEGLLKTKTDFREKDQIDKMALLKLKRGLKDPNVSGED